MKKINSKWLNEKDSKKAREGQREGLIHCFSILVWALPKVTCLGVAPKSTVWVLGSKRKTGGADADVLVGW